MKAAFFDLDRGLLRPRRRWRWLAWGRSRREPGQELAARIRPGAAELLARSRRQGHFIVLLTSGWEADRVTPAALNWGQLAVAALGADGVLVAPEASDPQSMLWRPAAVHRFCARYDFVPEVSQGFGAQAGDSLWLETLGTAAVLHPVRKLRRIARASAWAEIDLDQPL